MITSHRLMSPVHSIRPHLRALRACLYARQLASMFGSPAPHHPLAGRALVALRTCRRPLIPLPCPTTRLVDRLTREFRQPDLAPVGEGTDVILLAALGRVVTGHVLAAVARQHARELAPVGEVIAAIVELHVLAMP